MWLGLHTGQADVHSGLDWVGEGWEAYWPGWWYLVACSCQVGYCASSLFRSMSLCGQTSGLVWSVVNSACVGAWRSCIVLSGRMEVLCGAQQILSHSYSLPPCNTPTHCAVTKVMLIRWLFYIYEAVQSIFNRASSLPPCNTPTHCVITKVMLIRCVCFSADFCRETKDIFVSTAVSATEDNLFCAIEMDALLLLLLLV